MIGRSGDADTGKIDENFWWLMFRLLVAGCLCIPLCAAAVRYGRGQYGNERTESVQKSILLGKTHRYDGFPPSTTSPSNAARHSRLILEGEKALPMKHLQHTHSSMDLNSLQLQRHCPDSSEASYNGTIVYDGGLRKIICDGPKGPSIEELKQRFDLKELTDEKSITRAHEKLRHSGRLVGLLIKFKNLTDSARKRIGKAAWGIGKYLLFGNLKGIEKIVDTAFAMTTLGVGTTAKIIKDVAYWAGGNLEAVKAIDFPGKDLLVMLYPKGLVSIIDKTTGSIMHMLDAAHQTIKSAFAYSLYITLQVVARAVEEVAKKIECVKGPSNMVVASSKWLVYKLHVEGGKICGLPSISPVNNVTITRDDEKFLIVKTPWILSNLTVHFERVEVGGPLGITLINNEPMDVIIDTIKSTGTVSFEAGAVRRFLKIHLALDELSGLQLQFKNPNKSYTMMAVEKTGGYVSGIVSTQVSNALEQIQNKVYDYINNL